MAGDHAAKKGSPKKERASGMPRSAGKKVKTLPVEELSPERRSEIAQEAEAKQFRGKSPSTDRWRPPVSAGHRLRWINVRYAGLAQNLPGERTRSLNR